MDVLLFGSTGKLGLHLVQEFLRRGYHLCAPRSSDLDLFDLTRLNNFVGPWLSERPNSVVVYAAGCTDIKRCHDHPGNAEHLNVIAPFLLANLCSRVGARFVYFSTDQVFMRPSTSDFYLLHEGDNLDGVFKTDQVYGRTKADAERVIRRYPRSLTLRTSWLFGPHPTRSDYVRDVVTRAHHGEPIVGLTDYTACPSYAPDVAATTADIILHPDATGVYHLVNGPAISRYDMAQTILSHAGFDHPVTARRQDQMDADWIQRNPGGGLNNHRGPKLRPWTLALDQYLATLLPTLNATI